MSLTPPTPYSEGGDPQSEQSPGDPERELIHEVKNLAQVVTLLNRTYVRKEDFDRRARIMWVLITGAVITVTTVFITLFVIVHNAHVRENALINKLVGGCQQRNLSTASTNNLINGLLAINAQAAQLNPHPSAVERHIEAEYVVLLRNYQNSQPAPVDCQKIR